MTGQPYSDQAAVAAADSIQEEFDELRLQGASLIATVILYAAHDPLLGPDRSVNARTHRAEVIEEICAWLDAHAGQAAAKAIRREFGTQPRHLTNWDRMQGA